MRNKSPENIKMTFNTELSATGKFILMVGTLENMHSLKKLNEHTE